MLGAGPDQGYGETRRKGDPRVELLAVLGMHRSGTSLVAGVLHELGWHVGPAEDLMPPKPDNPRGFYEHLPAVRINDRLLHRAGGSWRAPPALPPGWERSRSLDDLRDEARDVVANLFAGGHTRVLMKDPRLSLTLPFWQTVVPIPRVVMVLREPGPVVRSLISREPDMSVEEAADLYVHYLLDSLSPAAERRLVDPRRLVESSEDGLRELAAALDHDPDAAAVTSALEHLDPALWGRTSRSAEHGSPPALGMAVAVHGLVTGPEGSVWQDVLGSFVARRTLGMLGDRHRAEAEHLRADQQRLQEARERVIGERDRAREVLALTRGHVDSCLAELDRLRTERDRIRSERDEARTAHRRTRERLEACQEELARLRSRGDQVLTD